MKTFITARMDQSEIKRLTAAGFNVEQGGFAITGEKMDKGELISKLSDVEVAIIEFESMSEEVINSAKNLKIIAACRNEPAANTDINAATAKGIPVLFTPGRNLSLIHI